MRRIHIIGGPGSGKTTLATQLAAKLNAPTYDLDVVAFENGAGAKRNIDLRLRDVHLNVSKQPVQTGEVGLQKEVVSQQQTVNGPVTHEEVYIENRPVTDATVDDNTPIGEGETIRVPVSDEKVNVTKDTVVTGEVSIGKRAVQENQQVTDTVRHEEARVDQQGNAIIHGSQNDNLHGNATNVDTTTTSVDDTTNPGNL